MNPYLQPIPKAVEDKFNFHHSCARIIAKYTFGENDRKWGIFWKISMRSRDHGTLIIEDAMRLNNFC